ncbi:MAG: ATP-binding protein [Desulfobulbaceae bacterium]|nr:ATP-binding protein [Desulfobulbaceae bacterium]
MHPFANLLKESESWLMRRIRDYAVMHGYARYTSTLEEAWRISVVGLTESIISALSLSEAPWELNPDDTYTSDPIASFGVLEAQRHRARGVSLEMFMGLMKYYRQTYLDLIRTSSLKTAAFSERHLDDDGKSWCRFVERVFDRIEIAFCVEWSRSETINSAIDELQTANRQISNEKNKFLTIFESLPVAVFLLDERRYILHMNHFAAKMITPEVVSGSHYYSRPEKRIPFPWLTDELASFQKNGGNRELDCLLELADGKKRQVLASFQTMQDVSLKYPGIVVILKDITEWKRAEEKLKQAEAHLIQQEKMASVGQLAAGVAHEINNPMGFISSNLSTLNKYFGRLAEFVAAEGQVVSHASAQEVKRLSDLRQRLKIDYIVDDASQLISESLDGVDRVRSIVRDLKSFSRIDQDDSAEVDLNETLETTINIAWNEIKYVATLNRELGDIPRIKCHSQQLGQVFLNLLINAAQAIEGEGAITVRTWSDDLNVYVSVSDTGRGIPPELLPRIFEPFFTTKEIGKGTGLGLSISYGVVKKHGGSIRVESEVGKGSAFTVVLPIERS